MRTRFPLWSRFVTVALPVFRSELRRRVMGTTTLLAALLLSINGLNVGNNYVTRDVMTALARRDEPRFYLMSCALIGVFVASTATAVLARYVEERLGLMWREWLTRRFVDRYLHDRTYLRILRRDDIDNPDQRISEDVKTFSASTLSLLIMAFNALLAIVTFSGVLCSINPWLLAAAFGYAVVGSLGTLLLGRSLVGLNNAQFRKEADFRYALVRIREHAKTVTQMAEERDERHRLGAWLHALVANWRKVVDVNRNLGFFVNGYNYLTQIIPILIVAPMYVRGEVEFGIVAQSVMAFTFTLNGFSLVVTQFQQLSSYAAVVNRLGALWEATMNEVPSKDEVGKQSALVLEVEDQGHRIAYERVTLESPREGRVLVKEISLEVPEGRRLIITGPNGPGKSALFLATAGRWEGGQGHIVRPPEPQSMFLPQHAYAIPGLLREHLLYGLDLHQVDEARVREVLRTVGLDEVVARVGGLDQERDWPNALSEGELQMFAVARLILANPRFAFLDHTLGVLDAAREEKIYAALSRTEITYVTIGDDPALFRFHDRRLDVRGDGSWSCMTT